MDYVIYHNRDLDGLSSGAVLLEVFEAINPDVKAIGYHYGDNFDTRKMMNKDVTIADVSLPIKKMISMGRTSNTMIWIDHHKTQLEELYEYVESKKDLSIEEKEGLSTIKTIQVREKGELLFTLYYSARRAACELCHEIFESDRTYNYAPAIKLLGQYDTWRNTPEKKFIDDEDWDKKVLPFQYGMRTYLNVWRVKEALKKIADWTNASSVDSHISNGRAILNYQEVINERNMEFSFDVTLHNPETDETHNGIAYNGGPFNSQTFKSVWDRQKYDFMMPFSFQGDKWNFSLYTDKDIDLTPIAKSFGGGGHKQACGFQLKPHQVVFDKDVGLLISKK